MDESLMNSLTYELNEPELSKQSQSQSYVTTDDQSANLSCNKAPIWGSRPDLYYSKGGRTPTASRQASRHETKEAKADVSIMTQTGVRRFL
jgi:hypothetical protein